MKNQEIIETLTKVANDIAYELNKSSNGKSLKVQREAKESLVDLGELAKDLFKQHNILKITHPHIKEENYKGWYDEMGVGSGLLHDIKMAILHLKDLPQANKDE